MRIIRTSAAVIAFVLLSGCAASIAYRADYVPDKPIVDSDGIVGRVLIYATQNDDDLLITAGARSFTANGFQLTTPSAPQPAHPTSSYAA
jgi:hypothetical protein